MVDVPPGIDRDRSKDKDLVCEKIDSMIESQTPFSVTHKWTIENFGDIFSENSTNALSVMYSNTFPTSNKLKFSIRLLPKYFDKTDQIKYVSLFLYLKMYQIPKETIPVYYELALLNSKNQKLISKGKMNYFKNEHSHGWDKFIQTEYLLDPSNKVLQNGNLIILCKTDIFANKLNINQKPLKNFYTENSFNCDMKVNHVNSLWEIEQFSSFFYHASISLEKNVCIQSKNFPETKENANKYYLRIWPKGIDEQSKKFMSIFLYCDISSQETNQINFAQYRLSVLDRSGEFFHSGEGKIEFLFDKNSTTSLGQGSTKFLQIDSIFDPKNGLLPGDKLTIYCEIEEVCNNFDKIYIDKIDEKQKTEVEPEKIKDLDQLLIFINVIQRFIMKIKKESKKYIQGPAVRKRRSQLIGEFEKEEVIIRKIQSKLEYIEYTIHKPNLNLPGNSNVDNEKTGCSEVKSSQIEEVQKLKKQLLQLKHTGQFLQIWNGKPLKIQTKDKTKIENVFKTDKLPVEEVEKIDQIPLIGDKFADCVIKVGYKKFSVHKNILSIRSPIFGAIFNGNLEENKGKILEIMDVDPDLFEELLCYFYTSKIPSVDKNAAEFFAFADKYQLDSLKSICENALYEQLDSDTMVNTFLLADLHSAADLKAKTIEFISTRTLPQDVIKAMLSNKNTRMFEAMNDYEKEKK